MRTTSFHFLLGGDAAYFEGVLAAACSTLVSVDASARCRFTVLDCGLTRAQIAALRESFGRLAAERRGHAELAFLPVGLERFRGGLAFCAGPAAPYARILAPELLSADEAVWIDADILVFSDLTRIWREVDRSALIAGVPDPVVGTLDGDPSCAHLEAGDRRYVNSGLLWMNLAAMRAEGFVREALRFAEVRRESPVYADQSIFNALTIGRRSLLAAHWNQLFQEPTSLGALLAMIGTGNPHFARKEKPWLNGYRHDLLVRDFFFFHVLRYLAGGAPVRKSASLARPPSRRRAWFQHRRSLCTGNRRKTRRWADCRAALRELEEPELAQARIIERLEAWRGRAAPAGGGMLYG